MNRSMQVLRTAICLVALAAAPKVLRADSDVDGLEVVLFDEEYSILAGEAFYTNRGRRTVIITAITISGTNLNDTGRFLRHTRVMPGVRERVLDLCTRKDPKKKSSLHVRLEMENE